METMAEDIASRIKQMAKHLDEEAIARAFKVSVEFVNEVLSGEITDEALSNFNIARPPDVRIIEKKQYLRAHSVGVLSLGSCGATTFAANLSYLAAQKHRNTIACLDLNEKAALAFHLGLKVGDLIPNRLNILFEAGDIAKAISHPDLENLFVFTCPMDIQNHLTLTSQRLEEYIRETERNYSMTVIDLPCLSRWEKLLPCLDTLLLLIPSNYLGMHYFRMVYPMLEKYQDRTAVVFSLGDQPVEECTYGIRQYTKMPVLGVLGYSPPVPKALNKHKIIAREYPGSDYVKAIEQVLEVLMPDQRKSRPKGFLSIFSR